MRHSFTKILKTLSETIVAGGLAFAADAAANTARADDIPLLGGLEDQSWRYEATYFFPDSGFDEEFRDINVTLLEAWRAFSFTSGVELQLGGGAFIADGERTEPFSDLVQESDAVGGAAGATLRYNLPALGPFRPFADVSAQAVWTPDDPFPGGGTAVNGLAQWGAGVAYRMSPQWTVEAGYRQSHLSNGGGISSYNPAWEGDGVFIALRRSLGD